MDNRSFSKIEIKEIIAATRLNLYNRCKPCGPKAILREMKDMGVRPLPSISAIYRIISRLGLTHGRTRYYQ